MKKTYKQEWEYLTLEWRASNQKDYDKAKADYHDWLDLPTSLNPFEKRTPMPILPELDYAYRNNKYSWRSIQEALKELPLCGWELAFIVGADEELVGVYADFLSIFDNLVLTRVTVWFHFF